MPGTTPSLAPVTFVLGVPRSGTTLLRVMLAGHPRLFSPPEMVIAPFATMAERTQQMQVRWWEKGGLRRALMGLTGCTVEEAKARERDMGGWTIPQVYAHLQELGGDRMLVDKCPHLCGRPEALPRLAGWFPEARWIWIVRHPGSVIRSLENMPMAEVMLQSYAPSVEEVWRTGNRVIGGFLEGIPDDRQARIRYEDLVTEPRAAMERVCAAMGVPFTEELLHPYDGERMREGPKGARAVGDPNLAGRKRIDPSLATKWLDGFDPRRLDAGARAYAEELGYDIAGMPLPAVAHASDAVQSLLRTAGELEAGTRLPMELDTLEGRRFLLRMLAASVDTFCEHGDPDHPAFEHAEGPTRKMFADNPDADYLRAPIRLGDRRVYRVWGRVPPGTVYVGVLLYGRGGRVGNRLSDADVALGDDGAFELRIALDEQPGAEQPPIELHIALEGDAGPPPPLDAAWMTKRLGLAERMLRGIFERTREAYAMASAAAINRFIEVPAERLFPTPDNAYRIAWYRIGGDQVALVRGRLPKARYFALTLYNAWLESLDYRHRTVSRNHAQIETDADGRFEVCVAPRDPGHPNWIDTAGHLAGYAVARFLLPEGELPELELEVCYARELDFRCVYTEEQAGGGATA
jgi:hypothetical protein